MSIPPLPSNGETNWGTKFRAWADALQGRKVNGPGMTVRHHTGAGERVLIDHPGGTTMFYGDTGWRTLTSWDETGTVIGTPLATGMEPVPGDPGSINIRRIGAEVTVSLHRVRMTGSSSITLPVGFRPGSALNYVIVSVTPINDSTTIEVRAGATTVFIQASMYPATGDATYRASFSFLSDTAWPSYLPGTPS